LKEWEEKHIFAVQMSCADALIFATLHCDTVKKQVLENLAHSGALLPLMEAGRSEVVAKVLSLLRSVAAIEPRNIVEELAEGTTEAVVDCLCMHAENPSVQRWGLAALGAIAQASSLLAAAAVRAGACDCVMWPLGADSFVKQPEVHREALFCAHSLLRDAGARAIYRRPSSRLCGLVSAVLGSSLDSPTMACSEVPLWGVRVLERLASSPQGGASAVEPFLDAIVKVMVTPACRNATALAGACAIAHLTNGSPVAKDRLQPHRVLLQKELQRRALVAAKIGDRATEKEFQDWTRVIIDGLADHKLGGVDEDAGDPPPERSEAGSETPPDSPKSAGAKPRKRK